MFRRQSLTLLVVLALGSATGSERPATQEKETPRTDRCGDPLPKGAIARLGTVRFRQPALKVAAVSTDGKILASSSGSDTIWLWEAATGKELRRISTEGHRDHYALAFSPDGKTLAAAGSDLSLWDTSSGKLVRQIGEDGQNLRSVAFASDGKTLASCGQDPIVHLWDPLTGKELHALVGHDKDGMVECVTFAPDSKTVASASRDGTVRTWAVDSGEVLDVYQAENACCSVAFSPDGKILAFGDWKGDIILQATKPGGERRRIEAGGGPMTCLGFSSDGSILAAGADHSTLRLFDPATGKECKESAAVPSDFGQGVWLPKTKVLAMWRTYGSAFHLWDVGAGKSADPGEGHFSSVKSFAVTPDGKVVVSTSYDGTIRYWDLATGRQVRCRRGTREEVANVLAISPDGKTLATGGQDAIVRLWDATTGKEIKQLQTTVGGIWSLRYSADGRTLYAGGYWIVQELDAVTGEVRGQFGDLPEAGEEPDFRNLRIVNQIVLSPDGRCLITTERFGRCPVFLWNARTRKERRSPNASKNLHGTIALSPDGRTLAGVRHSSLSGMEDENGICLWETATGKERFVLADKTLGGPLAFAPDGRTLATTGDRDDLVLVDVATGQEIQRFKGPGVNHIVFSPDGKTVLTDASDGTMLVWAVSSLPRKKDGAAQPKGRFKEEWTDLIGEDASKAYRAIGTIAVSADGVALLREHLHPVPVPTAESLQRFIRELDSNDFATREAATAELTKFAEAAEPALRQAREDRPAPEIKRRLERLLQRLESDDFLPSSDLLHSLRGLEALEISGIPEARQLLKELAQGAPDARLTRDAKAALDRLAKRSH